MTNLPADPETLLKLLRFEILDRRNATRVACDLLMGKAADEIERLERESASWSGLAAVRNRNIVLIAEERDQWREKCYLIYELLTGLHRSTMQQVTRSVESPPRD